MNRLLLRNADGADPGGSWNRDPEGIQAGEGADRSHVAKTGLRLFLAVVSSLFFLFLLAFIARSQMADWLPLTEPMAPLANPWQLWVNSAFLVLSCISLQWSRMAARRARMDATVIAFVVGGGFAIAFLAGQLWVWQQFVAWGYFVASNPANSFFYLLTGVHGLHLLGGLVAWGRTVGKFLRQVPLPQLSASVELCAIYWHYLLGLWFVLFALLTSTPQTYETIARLCGLR
ncbi:cytochrome C oxidase subunit III [Pseudomonas umsongensis]|jgi:cytochrome c oxidase subunit 3|uniref:Cytochrome C oxidase subunit III n=1 Tax=Pseudomonas umsongensis TaxID=198618 RepID=A0ABX4DQM0_9PSED|nr:MULTISPECIES: cytochrome c oxidase subunit 3 [Pseudomonas]KEX94954.1 cytochrome C oxidase subunit III [Pseudomonas putida]EPA95586.1 heme/copper-type cytochrome/quinol oxidase, subunit 3 [Pseudomonas sp. G5(2012)]MBT9569941.1 cytochrome c oxidase subunit 3 [Pseudomonas umsongensis]OXR29034.1 cytochrome C oxidase subunit III [Pseudomonas umsongensis]QFG32391.1 cytochrome C oxidase subunit III [Pseudomonas umsongensis]